MLANRAPAATSTYADILRMPPSRILKIVRTSYIVACRVYALVFCGATTTCPTPFEEAVVDARGSDAVAVVAELCIQAGQLWTLFLEASICWMKPGFAE